MAMLYTTSGSEGSVLVDDAYAGRLSRQKVLRDHGAADADFGHQPPVVTGCNDQFVRILPWTGS